jgi:hypothetical protein
MLLGVASLHHLSLIGPEVTTTFGIKKEWETGMVVLRGND